MVVKRKILRQESHNQSGHDNVIRHRKDTKRERESSEGRSGTSDEKKNEPRKILHYIS